MPPQSAVRAIILQNNKLLVMKRTKHDQHYYTLVGGRIEPGEDTETALRRELQEETGLRVGVVREVFIEPAQEPYGDQHLFLCEYQGGEPALSSDSEEAADTAAGENAYEPVWLPIDQITVVPFRSKAVQKALVESLQHGFPEKLQKLA
jgi:8-oxo-dGTP diphosphatase